MSSLIFETEKNRYKIDGCMPQRSAIEQRKIGFHALSHGHYPGTPIAGDVLPGISSMGYLDAIGEQDWGMEDHRNEGIEICLQETGTADLFVDGVHFPMPAKTLSITRPWQLHRVGNPHLRPGRLHWIIVDVGVRRPNQIWEWPTWCVLTDVDLQELTASLRGNERPVWNASDEILQVFHRLALDVAGDNPTRRASRIMVSLNQLLLAMLELFRSQPIAADQSLTSQCRTVELFLDELQQMSRMREHRWTLDEMAKHCGMGRTAFAQMCREITNTTPIDYLNRCRLEGAARRLADEPYVSITTIALDAGFSSSQYFSQSFKSRYSKSPRQWRADRETR